MMKYIFIAFFATVSSLLKEDDIYILNEENFKSTIETLSPILV
jgi:hypothetical protein